ncbi:unnamed protein product [Clavelina lepadiformis]|uniref:Uncharacterized protein n=1 Tax=Clavelina lepadiformis TaxID=159417 RepID=A0ABP0FFL4_CLALP
MSSKYAYAEDLAIELSTRKWERVEGTPCRDMTTLSAGLPPEMEVVGAAALEASGTVSSRLPVQFLGYLVVTVRV